MKDESKEVLNDERRKYLQTRKTEEMVEVDLRQLDCVKEITIDSNGVLKKTVQFL